MELHQAETLAKNLMKEHNLIGDKYSIFGKSLILGRSWKFEFNNRIMRGIGRCDYTNKIISLSKPLTKLNNENFVKETIIHEIAHALCGRGTGHSKIWKNKCDELGIKPNRITNIDEIIMPKAKYIIECPNCKKQTKRFKKLGKIGIACGLCCKKYNNGKYTDKFKLVYVK